MGRKREAGRYVHDKLDVKPKIKIEFMDLSAHAGKSGLIDFIKKVNPKQTFLVHGERTEEFAKELNNMGLNTTAPKNGEKMNI